jgi:transcriptional regulator with XRE-family HTH domain
LQIPICLGICYKPQTWSAEVPKSTNSRRGKPATASKTRQAANQAKQKVGAYITALRIAQDMTQEQLGRLLGVRNTYVSHVEVGRATISPERYGAFADPLGVTRPSFGRFLLRHYNPELLSMLEQDEEEEEVGADPHGQQRPGEKHSNGITLAIK